MSPERKYMPRCSTLIVALQIVEYIEMTEAKTVVVPLTGANYCTGKVQCKMSLMCNRLWGIVSRAETPPETGTDCHAKFITRRDHALAAMVLFVNQSLLYLLGDPTDPAAVR